MSLKNRCMHIYRLLVLLPILLANSAYSSANRYLHEKETLVALSDITYTVIAEQYEQTSSYTTSYQRLLIRVLRIDDNSMLSEVALTGFQVDREIDEPHNMRYSLLENEKTVFSDIVAKPQTVIKNNINSSSHSEIRVDGKKAYVSVSTLKKDLELDLLKVRFPNILTDYESKDLEITGWYSVEYSGQKKYFIVLKNGLCNCDLDSFEYVFSVSS